MLRNHNWDLDNFFDDIRAIRSGQSNFSERAPISGCRSRLFSLEAKSIPCDDTFETSVPKLALCGPRGRAEAWRIDGRGGVGAVVQDKQDPRFVGLLHIITGCCCRGRVT